MILEAKVLALMLSSVKRQWKRNRLKGAGADLSLSPCNITNTVKIRRAHVTYTGVLIWYAYISVWGWLESYRRVGDICRVKVQASVEMEGF